MLFVTCGMSNTLHCFTILSSPVIITYLLSDVYLKQDSRLAMGIACTFIECLKLNPLLMFSHVSITDSSIVQNIDNLKITLVEDQLMIGNTFENMALKI